MNNFINISKHYFKNFLSAKTNLVYNDIRKNKLKILGSLGLTYFFFSFSNKQTTFFNRKVIDNILFIFFEFNF